MTLNVKLKEKSIHLQTQKYLQKTIFICAYCNYQIFFLKVNDGIDNDKMLNDLQIVFDTLNHKVSQVKYERLEK